MTLVLGTNATVVLEAVTCGACGIVFGMPKDFVQKRREDHKTWHCPNGHPRAYLGKSEAEKLRDELARQKHLTEQADAGRTFWREEQEKTERSLRATKAVVTRTKRKVSKGDCPCCSRHFKDLAAHMKTEHPKWDPDRAAQALATKAASVPSPRRPDA